MEQVKLLSMTAALTVLIWATADSLVNESTTIRVSIQVSPSPANPGMLAELPEGDVVTLLLEVAGERKLIARVQADPQPTIQLQIPYLSNGPHTLSAQEYIEDQWRAYPNLAILSVKPAHFDIVVDHMVTEDVPVRIRRPSLTYDAPPQLEQSWVRVTLRQSILDQAKLDGRPLQFEVDPEPALMNRPAGESVRVAVALVPDPAVFRRQFGRDALVNPKEVFVRATIAASRATVVIPSCPVVISVAVANFGKAFHAEDDNGRIPLLTRAITVSGPVDVVERLARGTPPRGEVFLTDEDLRTWESARTLVPEFRLPASVELIEVEPVRFRLVEGG